MTQDIKIIVKMVNIVNASHCNKIKALLCQSLLFTISNYIFRTKTVVTKPSTKAPMSRLNESLFLQQTVHLGMRISLELTIGGQT